MESVQNSQLKKRIMRRVYFIYLCKKYFFNRLALKVYFSIALIIGLLSNVSVVNVFSNMLNTGSSGMGGISYFSKYAIMHTEVTVQVILILATIFILSNLVPLIKNLRIFSIRNTQTF